MKLRKLEIAANEAFDTYREMYFEGGVSSVYLWDLDDGGFAGVVVLKKVLNVGDASAPSSSWDSIHVFEAAERGRQAHYKLTSTIMLYLGTKKEGVKGSVEQTSNGEILLSGSMTRQIEQDHPVNDTSSHVSNTGRMIEEQEIKMRNLLQDVYFGKTRDVVHELRSIDSLEKARQQRQLQKELVGLMGRK